jgi:non-ribosomal peptide synthetase component F
VAYEHQDVPFERLVEELSPERSLNTTPLFQVVFALQNAPMDKQQLKQLEVTPVRGGELRVRFDLEVHAFERGGEIALLWVYNRDLFDRWRMEQMARHYVRMLDAVVRDPGCAAGRVEMLSATERQQLLYEWNATATAFPADKCVHQLFEEQVEKTPEAVAVVFEGKELSYAELNRRANQLAHYLRKLGVEPDDLIGVCIERSVEMVVALLGVLKAGGAYVPLEPEYPVERLRFMIKDAGLKLVLSHHGLWEPAGLDGQWLWIDKLQEELALEATEDFDSGLDAEALAYVIYTSGSTGQPKAAMNRHRGISNRLKWSGKRRPGASEDTFQLRCIGLGVFLAVADRGGVGYSATGRTPGQRVSGPADTRSWSHDGPFCAFDAAGIPRGGGGGALREPSSSDL